MAMYLRTTTLISLAVVATNLILGVPAAYCHGALQLLRRHSHVTGASSSSA